MDTSIRKILALPVLSALTISLSGCPMGYTHAVDTSRKHAPIRLEASIRKQLPADKGALLFGLNGINLCFYMVADAACGQTSTYSLFLQNKQGYAFLGPLAPGLKIVTLKPGRYTAWVVDGENAWKGTSVTVRQQEVSAVSAFEHVNYQLSVTAETLTDMQKDYDGYLSNIKKLPTAIDYNGFGTTITYRTKTGLPDVDPYHPVDPVMTVTNRAAQKTRADVKRLDCRVTLNNTQPIDCDVLAASMSMPHPSKACQQRYPNIVGNDLVKMDCHF